MRSKRTLRGKGAYWGKFLGDKVGFGQFGSDAENFLIDKGMSAMRSYRGRGSYTSGGPRATAGGSIGVPQFSDGSDPGSVVVTHREYIGDIIGTTMFTNSVWPINPGDAQTFPWLSQIAQNYDEYEFGGLVFCFQTTTTDLTTTSAQLGTVIATTNYNAAAAPFSSKQVMMEYTGASRVKISQNMECGVECDPKQNGLGAILYVAPNGSVPGTEDPKTYILGNFQLATNSCVATGQIGELWVTYKVTLRKPKLSVAIAAALPTSRIYSLVSVASTTGSILPITGQFNNVEDMNYSSALPIVSATQITGGLKLLGTFTPTVTTIGWNVSFASSALNVGYVLPLWLGIGTYEFTLNAQTFGATLGFGTGAAVSTGIVINRYVNCASTSGSANCTMTVTVSQSYESSGVVQWVTFGALDGVATIPVAAQLLLGMTQINPSTVFANAET